MSTPVQVQPTVAERRYGGVGRCKCSFWFAVAHDLLGVLVIMVGVFGGLAVHDLFIYAGAIIIFFSLIWWVFWYSGNIDVAPEELEDDVGLSKRKNRGIGRVVRHVSNRLSSSFRNSFRRSGDPAGRRPAGDTRAPPGQRPAADVVLSVLNENTRGSASDQVARETMTV
ncbi:transmembrane protein 238-like [Lampris incognitus]|uniref:transmembrane protein 238-like n=1 Tax=Lampris incognitus TaxID=2546036 RepID=UPI0024B4B903|nr:transmembrane protein 238-like [Lampris incognitus]